MSTKTMMQSERAGSSDYTLNDGRVLTDLFQSLSLLLVLLSVNNFARLI